MATHFSVLAWRIPWTEEPGGLQSMGLQRVEHDWSNLPGTHWPDYSPIKLVGLPWWLSSKISACQCRRHGFSPWVGKISWRREWQPTPIFLPRKFHGQVHGVAKSWTWLRDKHVHLVRVIVFQVAGKFPTTLRVIWPLFSLRLMVMRMKLIRRTRERGSSLTKSNHQDLPSGQVIKTLPSQCGGHRFDL